MTGSSETPHAAHPIASIEGRQPTDFHGHYATAKAGLPGR